LFTSYLTANGAVVDTDGFNVKINNILENAPSETGTLTKLGAGTLTLAGDNLYTGATTVEAGKLVVNGSMGGGMITVKNGAELGGSSTGAGPISMENGSTLSPGNSIGTLEAGDLTLEGTTTWAMELDNDGSTSDQISLSGDLIAGFTFQKVILDFLGGGVNGGSYLLMPTFAGVDSLTSSDFEVTNLAAGLSGTVNLDTTASEMTLTVIPEPGTLGALGLFAVAALLRRRLRR
jgi:autotransporter-associated beta strand protein